MMTANVGILAAAVASVHGQPNFERDFCIDGIDRALESVRRHLGMDVAFISEFSSHERIFRYVNSLLPEPPIQQGQRISLTEGYCKKVIDGDLPEMIPDTKILLAAAAIPETKLLQIGSHMSVPIRLRDGSIYGTFCCFSRAANPSLNDRDLSVMKTVAELVAMQIDVAAGDAAEKHRIFHWVRTAIANGQPDMVYQPIFRLSDGLVVGAEALARFSNMPRRPPDQWFADAEKAGLRAELEIAAIENALSGYAQCWNLKEPLYLAVNVSAATVIEHDLLTHMGSCNAERLILEITEHDHIENYDLLEKALKPLRARGIRVAVDDAGSGYASLRHVLRLNPDILKLDISLTRNVDKDPMRRAMASAIMEFSRQTGCAIVAEGVETPDEFATLSELGIPMGQGYFLRKPGPAMDVLRNFDVIKKTEICGDT